MQRYKYKRKGIQVRDAKHSEIVQRLLENLHRLADLPPLSKHCLHPVIHIITFVKVSPIHRNIFCATTNLLGCTISYL